MKVRALVAAILLGCSVAALASPYSFEVKTTGSGRPVILIPGLTCDGSVWAPTVERLKTHYRCYVLSLPGFAGRKPITGPYLPRIRDEIIAYVKDHHIDHPAVIGHSLGGFMALYLASSEPNLFGPIISVDGVPFYPAIFNPAATAENSKPMAEAVVKSMTGSREQFEKQVKSALDSEITDPRNAKALYPICTKSDPADVAQAMKEMISTDLRQDIARIKSPLMLLGAGGWLPSNPQMVRNVYAAQLANAPKARLVIASKAKHFVMLDDPEFFHKTVEQFLSAK